MNNELLIERGNNAEGLLNNGVFQQVTTELINIYMNALLQTKPDSSKERETLYAGARAVQDITGVLNQWVAIRDQIIENASYEESDS